MDDASATAPNTSTAPASDEAASPATSPATAIKHGKKVSIGNAASLFGAGSSADFFSSLGATEEENEEEETAAAASPAGTPGQTAGLFGTDSTASGGTDWWSQQQQQPAGATSTGYGYDASAQTQDDGTNQYAGQEQAGYNQQYGGYDAQSQSYDGYSQPYQGSYGSSSNGYDAQGGDSGYGGYSSQAAADPNAGYGYAAQADPNQGQYAYHAAPASPALSSFDPYAQAAQSNSYSAAANPYAPPSSSANPYAPPSAAVSTAPTSSPAPPAPPALKRAAPTAYDPPPVTRRPSNINASSYNAGGQSPGSQAGNPYSPNAPSTATFAQQQSSYTPTGYGSPAQPPSTNLYGGYAPISTSAGASPAIPPPPSRTPSAMSNQRVAPTSYDPPALPPSRASTRSPAASLRKPSVPNAYDPPPISRKASTPTNLSRPSSRTAGRSPTMPTSAWGALPPPPPRSPSASSIAPPPRPPSTTYAPPPRPPSTSQTAPPPSRPPSTTGTAPPPPRPPSVGGIAAPPRSGSPYGSYGPPPPARRASSETTTSYGPPPAHDPYARRTSSTGYEYAPPSRRSSAGYELGGSRPASRTATRPYHLGETFDEGEGDEEVLTQEAQRSGWPGQQHQAQASQPQEQETPQTWQAADQSAYDHSSAWTGYGGQDLVTQQEEKSSEHTPTTSPQVQSSLDSLPPSTVENIEAEATPLLTHKSEPAPAAPAAEQSSTLAPPSSKEGTPILGSGTSPATPELLVSAPSPDLDRKTQDDELSVLTDQPSLGLGLNDAGPLGGSTSPIITPEADIPSETPPNQLEQPPTTATSSSNEADSTPRHSMVNGDGGYGQYEPYGGAGYGGEYAGYGGFGEQGDGPGGAQEAEAGWPTQQGGSTMQPAYGMDSSAVFGEDSQAPTPSEADAAAYGTAYNAGYGTQNGGYGQADTHDLGSAPAQAVEVGYGQERVYGPADASYPPESYPQPQYGHSVDSSYDNGYGPYGGQESSASYYGAYGGYDANAGAGPLAPSAQTQQPEAQDQNPPIFDPYAPSSSSGWDSQSTNETSRGTDPYALNQASSYGEYGSASAEYQSPTVQTSPYARSYDSRASQEDRRDDRRVYPVATFGFGGKLVTFFPAPQSQSGYGSGYFGATSSQEVSIRKVADVVPTIAGEVESFPGPVFMDGGSKASAGKKRKDVVAWLQSRVAEIEKEANFFIGTSATSFDPLGGDGKREKARELEEKKILLKIMEVLVENEGRSGGTPKLDEAIRRALLSVTDEASDITDEELPTAASLGSGRGLITASRSNEASPLLATYSLHASDLDKIQAFLLRGERRRAIQYATDNKLWGHAFVIASNVDADSLKAVVSEFVRAELGAGAGAVNGREPLRVAYSLFAGMGPAAIQEFIPQISLSGTSGFSSLMPPTQPLTRSATPVSPTFPDAALVGNLPAEGLAKWRETSAMIVANRPNGDSATLTSLGDTLLTNRWVAAAHACYLLSPTTSLVGGVGAPSTRIVLVGSQSPKKNSVNVDLLPVMLTELLEFAWSLAPVTKGQEPYTGIPHLQAFRLVHANQLADLGNVAAAQRYCDAITATLKLSSKTSPYYHPVFLNQIKELSDRLLAAPHQDKSGSWMTRKLTRPTIDSVWTTLEGRFAKFVAGEGDEAPDAALKAAEAVKPISGQIGPFSHYSSISPASTSGTLSRAQSHVDLGTRPSNTPPPAAPILSPIRKASMPLPRTASPAAVQPAAPPSKGHNRNSSLGYSAFGYDPYAGPSKYDPPPPSAQPLDEAAGEDAAGIGTPTAGGGPDAPWWASSGSGSSTPANVGADSHLSANYARAPAFTPIAESFAEDSSGFMSPMARQPPTVTPQTNRANFRHSYQPPPSTAYNQDDEDDMGLGNSRRRDRRSSMDSGGDHYRQQSSGSVDVATDSKGPGNTADKESSSSAPAKPELKSTPSSSWLGRIFRRDASNPASPGPVKANLGEETSFVYDPELKRWVNKKAGPEEAKPALPPPPPSRAKTASPTAAAQPGGGPPRPFSAAPMPSRSLTDMARPPPPRSPAPPQTSDSNTAGTATPPPSVMMGAPPPGRRAGGAAGKKPVRARYVDVMQDGA